ncbi:hypothetical protein PC9H_011489 [Pleurotus ostreatus]|uniref:CBF1-interacting co-repressor CIR N-terminal domain-containing protein n=1 Tax=Pleurotus ostreatus TaxID=5322 RepID=A0A8H7DLI5_PLEOS|nr:uncharacterized protein PC9H_011489 [Pleurotus ostreatus]KAF7420970.1 hypothetical protein PC9H_011489 [Pleurotus ostreatus]
MGKLNIAHHKSYHPYRRDNIERVRKDEEEAARKEAQEEGRMMLADSEARIDLLRERAGTQRDSSGRRSRKRDDFDEEKVATTSAPQPALTNPNGHINLFEDLEQSQMSAAIRSSSKKKSDPVETDKGVPLAPSAKDLNPWYSSRNDDSKPVDEAEEGRRKRDKARQAMHDPLTSISRQLASHHASSAHATSSRSSHRSRPTPSDASRPPEVNARLARESSERERALELIRRKKREMMGSETPSTVHGGGYTDVFNRKEVEDAHRVRDRDLRRSSRLQSVPP